MRRLIYAIVVLATATGHTSAQILDRTRFAQSVILLRDETIAITQVNGIPVQEGYRTPDGQFMPKYLTHMGTGFLIQRGSNCFIVTASHVAVQLSASAFLISADEQERTVKILLSNLVGTNASPAWIRHPVADIAILKVEGESPYVAFCRKHALPETCLLAERRIPDRDTELTTFGFPLGLGASESFSPLTRRSHAASGILMLPRFDTKTPQAFFVLEDPSIGGFSGGPVVDQSIYVSGLGMSTGGGTLIYGIVHGTLADDTGGKLAAVTPAALVSELISHCK